MRTSIRAVILGVAALFSSAVVTPARGAVTLLLEQPYGELGAFNPTGHSALYFDNICSDGPLTLRACRPGELGVVISRYDGIDHYDWLAMPLVPYLYAVETGEEIPDVANRALALQLRNRYRQAHLEDIAPDTPTGATPPGNWYELIGGAYDRTIFGFQVKTTPDQDRQLIAWFNDRGNHERYNGMFNNCADFSRVVLNRLYPHAVRRNYIADLGMTTPKSVARALVHYAKHHPEADLHMVVIPQVPGSIHRSVDVQGVSESLLKRYGIPLIILSPHTTAVIFAAYVTHGRFALPKKAAELDVAALEREKAVDAMGGLDVAYDTVPEGSLHVGDDAAPEPTAVAALPVAQGTEVPPRALPVPYVAAPAFGPDRTYTPASLRTAPSPANAAPGGLQTPRVLLWSLDPGGNE